MRLFPPDQKRLVPAPADDVQRAYQVRSEVGLERIFSIPPRASIGEIERLIDTMLALSSSRGEQ